MIKPHKYMDLDVSIVSIGALMLSLLRNSNMVKYDELLDQIIKEKGESVKELFSPTLSFLFLLGKVEYHQSIDSIELL